MHWRAFNTMNDSMEKLVLSNFPKFQTNVKKKRFFFLFCQCCVKTVIFKFCHLLKHFIWQNMAYMETYNCSLQELSVLRLYQWYHVVLFPAPVQISDISDISLHKWTCSLYCFLNAACPMLDFYKVSSGIGKIIIFLR